MDYTWELKVSMVVMVSIKLDQFFEVFKNSCPLNSCSS